MKQNKVIQRICCVCRVKQPTTDMTRVVRVAGVFMVEKGKRLNGRGCHVCPKCKEMAIKKKALNRSFKRDVPDEIYKDL